MSIIERDTNLEYVRSVARKWRAVNAAIDEPEAQERAMQWERVLLAETPEEISRALDVVATGLAQANEQEGEADGH